VLTSLRDAVEVYADTGAEVIEEMLSKREIRARRGRIVPLPLQPNRTFSGLWITAYDRVLRVGTVGYLE
jgi:hypothetical protein